VYHRESDCRDQDCVVFLGSARAIDDREIDSDQLASSLVPSDKEDGGLDLMRKLAVPAAVFHFTATALMYFAGRFVSLSQLFPDAAKYQAQIIILVDVLKTRGFGAWFFAFLPFHVKLYSLCFAAFGRWMSFSILLLEPLNALCYVGILLLVFSLGRRILDEQTALLATVIIAVWPSFLAHTTQPLKDPVFIALALVYLTINSLWLIRDYSLRRALAITGLGLIIEFFLWIVKSDMWELMIAIGLLTCGAVLIRMLRSRKFLWGNLAGAVLLVLLGVIIPRVAMQFYQPALSWAQNRGVAALYTEDEPAFVSSSVSSYSPAASFPGAKISQLRHRFIILYPDAGSNIDTDVEFKSTADIIRYLPRAALIGLFAPFPNTWFVTGLQNGRLGRLIGGSETLVLYLIELMALIGLWHKRREVSAWWLLLIPLIGCVSLGLVVTNVGALYRMRYVFVMLLVILGSYGFRQTLRYIASVRTRRHSSPTDIA
jgi:hypothetical protein